MSTRDLNADRKFIRQEIIKRLKVAISSEEHAIPERDGMRSELYNFYESQNLLIPILDFEARLKEMHTADDEAYKSFKPLQKQFQALDDELNLHSKMLSENALLGKVDVYTVKAEIYNRIAKLFTLKHKEKLVLDSPSAWL